MKYLKLTVFTILMLIITGVFMSASINSWFNFNLFEQAFMNDQLNYQLSGLVLAMVTLGITYLFADKIRLGYLNFNREGKLLTERYLGINEEGVWKEDGWSYGLIMMVIMGITAFVGVFQAGFSFSLTNSLIAIIFAATNAFTEEVIFRLSYVTMGANETSSNRYGIIMGSIVFGIIHYFGIMPNGIIGVILSLFLGYFLTKSMQETKGFFWAFMIHFMLDIVIMLLLFNARM